jgi:hypothetical protein
LLEELDADIIERGRIGSSDLGTLGRRLFGDQNQQKRE